MKTLKAHSRPLQALFSRQFSAQVPRFLSEDPNSAIDILYAESNDILFNLATEEYMYEHLNIVNPVLFLWRNSKTIIIGKHQNPWKECRV